MGIGADSEVYRIIEHVLPFANEIHEQTNVYQLNALAFMYRQLSVSIQEAYITLLPMFECLEALSLCRNESTVYLNCHSRKRGDDYNG